MTSSCAGRTGVAALCVCLALGGCSKTGDNDGPEHDDARVPAVKSSAGQAIAAHSVTTICATWTKGQRVRYQLAASGKLHMGVSIGPDSSTSNPVAMHITRNEVRTFPIRKDGEYCFHLDNRQDQAVHAEFEYTAL